MTKALSETDAPLETPDEIGFLLVPLAKQLDHDLNNAFAVMIGNLRFLRTSAETLLREETLAALADVEHACDEAAVLSHAVLGLMSGIQTQPVGAHPLEQILARAERAIRRGLRGEIALAASDTAAHCSVRTEAAVLEAILVALALAAQRDLGTRGMIHVTALLGQASTGRAKSSKPRPPRMAQILIEPERPAAGEVAAPTATSLPWTERPVLAIAKLFCEQWGGALTMETSTAGLPRATILLCAED